MCPLTHNKTDVSSPSEPAIIQTSERKELQDFVDSNTQTRASPKAFASADIRRIFQNLICATVECIISRSRVCRARRHLLVSALLWELGNKSNRWNGVRALVWCIIFAGFSATESLTFNCSRFDLRANVLLRCSVRGHRVSKKKKRQTIL